MKNCRKEGLIAKSRFVLITGGAGPVLPQDITKETAVTAARQEHLKSIGWILSLHSLRIKSLLLCYACTCFFLLLPVGKTLEAGYFIAYCNGVKWPDLTGKPMLIL